MRLSEACVCAEEVEVDTEEGGIEEGGVRA